VKLRPYQEAALDALNNYWNAGGGHPLVAMATATGKSVLIAELLRSIAANFPDLRALDLVHVRELLEQNLEHLTRLWPDAPYGVNSAGLGRRDWDAPIVLASIQSVWRNPQRLGVRHLVIVDEAHLVPHAGEGMYRSLFSGLRLLEPDLRVAGFTATPFRLDTGRLDEGDGKIFDKVVFEYGLASGIADGWLAPLSSKATSTSIDVSNVAIHGGEFVPGALEDAADNEKVVAVAVDEIITAGEDRHKWLLFCCGVRHARHVRDVLISRGISAATVTAETPDRERDAIIAAYRAGEIRALTNVNIAIVGFDVPGVDLIAMLRPTLSTGLYVQMCGRGTRLADGKQNCLVLDFAWNVRRHGPVDQAEGSCRSKVGVGDAPTKICPRCREIVALAATQCNACGYEFLVAVRASVPKHAPVADLVPILGGPTDWLPVTETSCRRHVKFSDDGAPPSFRVDYLCGFSDYSEFISFERDGFAREMAVRWWHALCGRSPVPETVSEALERLSELAPVLAIKVTREGKWWRVIGHRLRRHDGAEIDVDRWNRWLPVPDMRPTKEIVDDEIRF
jgi:DNA repair protein RadD